MGNMYVSLKDFRIESKISESTIRNFIKEVLRFSKDLVRIIKNKYYLSKELVKYFKYPYKMSVSYYLFLLRNKGKRKNEVLLSTSWKEYLYDIKWDLWGHINYEPDLTIIDCMFQFYKVEKILRKEFGPGVKLFFTTERNKGGRKGFHNHFVLYSSDKSLLGSIKITIDLFFRRNGLSVTDVEKYIKEKKGLRYIMKEIDIIKDGYGLIET
ncbi:MAG: hypothetical protein ABR927_12755 [Bacteroidales bacterium]|jgi:hypothetical protein